MAALSIPYVVHDGACAGARCRLRACVSFTACRPERVSRGTRSRLQPDHERDDAHGDEEEDAAFVHDPGDDPDHAERGQPEQ